MKDDRINLTLNELLDAIGDIPITITDSGEELEPEVAEGEMLLPDLEPDTVFGRLVALVTYLMTFTDLNLRYVPEGAKVIVPTNRLSLDDITHFKEVNLIDAAVFEEDGTTTIWVYKTDEHENEDEEETSEG